MTEKRIADLDALLRHAVIIEDDAADAGDVVRIGSTVVVDVEGDEERYTIVGAIEAKPAQGLISNESPVGRRCLVCVPERRSWPRRPMARCASGSFASSVSLAQSSAGQMDRLTITYERVWAAFQRAGRPLTVGTIPLTGERIATHTRHASSAFRPKLPAELTIFAGSWQSSQAFASHPDHFLHIMLQESGLLSKSRDNLTRSAQRGSRSLPSRSSSRSRARVPCRSHWAASIRFQDAVFLGVRGGCSALAAARAVVRPGRLAHTPSYSYLPHCTIAHYDGTTPHEEALDAPCTLEKRAHWPVRHAESRS